MCFPNLVPCEFDDSRTGSPVGMGELGSQGLVLTLQACAALLWAWVPAPSWSVALSSLS